MSFVRINDRVYVDAVQVSSVVISDTAVLLGCEGGHYLPVQPDADTSLSDFASEIVDRIQMGRDTQFTRAADADEVSDEYDDSDFTEDTDYKVVTFRLDTGEMMYSNGAAVGSVWRKIAAQCLPGLPEELIEGVYGAWLEGDGEEGQIVWLRNGGIATTQTHLDEQAAVHFKSGFDAALDDTFRVWVNSEDGELVHRGDQKMLEWFQQQIPQERREALEKALLVGVDESMIDDADFERVAPEDLHVEAATEPLAGSQEFPQGGTYTMSTEEKEANERAAYEAGKRDGSASPTQRTSVATIHKIVQELTGNGPVAKFELGVQLAERLGWKVDR